MRQFNALHVNVPLPYLGIIFVEVIIGGRAETMMKLRLKIGVIASLKAGLLGCGRLKI